MLPLLRLVLYTLVSQVVPSTDTQRNNLPNVIVVGGGLAGLATSLGLANTGKFQVDVVELRPDFQRMGATFGLALNGVKALDELDPDGIMPMINKIGIDLTPINSSLIMLNWGMMRNALFERLASKPQLVRFHMGYTLQDIVDDPNERHVKATFVRSSSSRKMEERGSEEDVLTLQGCLVVGTDGVRSTVRSYLNCPPAEKVGQTIWRGNIVVDPEHPGTNDPAHHQIVVGLLNQGLLPFVRVFGPTIFSVFNFHSKSPGRINWSISSFVTDVPPKSHPWETVLEPFVENADDKQLIQALFSLTEEDDLYNSMDFLVVRPPPDQDSNGWGGKGRVMLMGDAAHAMRAASGQGGSMAFEDAVVLCRALREMLQKEGIGLDDVLADFAVMSDLVLRVENSRIGRVRRVWDVETIMGEGRYFVNQDKPGNPWTPEHARWLYEGV